MSEYLDPNYKVIESQWNVNDLNARTYVKTSKIIENSGIRNNVFTAVEPSIQRIPANSSKNALNLIDVSKDHSTPPRLPYATVTTINGISVLKPGYNNFN